MDQNQDTSLFGLGIEPATKAHLSEAAKWAKFLAILGFVIIGLILVFGFFFGSILGVMSGNIGPRGPERGFDSAVSGFVVFMYAIIAAVYFFPCLFLFRFASQMKTALAANDQKTLDTSFQNLKKMFRYIGIIMIIFLALFALQFLFLFIGVGVSRL